MFGLKKQLNNCRTSLEVSFKKLLWKIETLFENISNVNFATFIIIYTYLKSEDNMASN